MDIYKPICKSIVIPLWAAWERTPYLKHLEYLEKSQYFPIEKVREIQWRKLKHLLKHAYQNCRYYKERFDQEKIDPDEIRSFDDFGRIPILTKSEVLEHHQGLLAPNVDRYMTFLTSGSTGKPLRGFWNKECAEFKRACNLRSNLWAGYELGERMYCLYGNPEKELKGIKRLKARFRRHFLQRTEILDMLQITDESMLKFVTMMQKKPPSILWGHAHGLYLLARFCEKKGIDDIRPKGMYSAGMILHDWERKKVEEVFHGKLQDRYGCEELGLVATECKEQKGLHINTDNHYVEFLRKDGTTTAPGEHGFVVITDLANHAMPFLRYRIEDIGIPSNERCPCGRTQPLIKKIEGRVADFLINPEGKLVSGISLTDHFAGQIPGVVQMQIVQERINFLRLNVVKSEGFCERSEQTVSHLIKEFFGEGMEFEYAFVDDIPQGTTGKYRFTICNVKNDYFE